MNRISKRRRAALGRPRLSDVEAKNAAIRRAALEVFAAKGFAGASIAEIADRASVTRRTLYARYASKEDLFAAAVAGLTDDRWPHYDASKVDNVERLLFEIAADLTVRSPSAALLLRIIVSEGGDLPGIDSTVRLAGRDHLLQPLTTTFQTLIERGLLPLASARDAATLFMDMVIGAAMLNILTFAPNDDAETLLRSKVKFYFAGFEGWAKLISNPLSVP